MKIMNFCHWLSLKFTRLSTRVFPIDTKDMDNTKRVHIQNVNLNKNGEIQGVKAAVDYSLGDQVNGK